MKKCSGKGCPPGKCLQKRRLKGARFTCLDCGHRGWRVTIRSRCPMCGTKATASNTV